MKIQKLALLFLTICTEFIQAQSLSLVSDLTMEIQESSGLLYLQNVLISHNDSGGKAELYELNNLDGSILRTVIVANATNVDWEDLAADSTYIYIGDFGNNNGNRTNLKIYRIELDAFWNTPNDTVYADTISFSYQDQQNFTSSPFTTNFDAEALLILDNKLLLFSKNWGNKWTKVYEIPKQPGNYSLQLIDSLNVEAFITGASSSTTDLNAYLIGYDFSTAYFYKWEYPNFSETALHKYPLNIPSGYSYQVEGVTEFNNSSFYLSSEALGSSLSALFLLDASTISAIEELTKKESILFPNPCKGYVEILQNNAVQFEVYNALGQQVLQSSISKFSVRELADGTYTILSKNSKGRVLSSDIIFIQK